MAAGSNIYRSMGNYFEDWHDQLVHQVNCDSKTSRKIQQGSLTDLTVPLIVPSMAKIFLASQMSSGRCGRSICNTELLKTVEYFRRILS